MDGPHDLGGKHGFGAVDTTAPPFQYAWEQRQWALSKNVKGGDPFLDAWRHGVEQMAPATYLSVPYFVKWCLNDLAFLIAAGTVTLEEALAGHAVTQNPEAQARDVSGALARLRANNTDFRRPDPAPPTFEVGGTARCIRHGHAGHTRLPAYARGATGRIVAHHGAHVFPDAAAHGPERAEHLYTVEFSARDLWGRAAAPRDSVCLDLWESYLVAP